MPIAHARMCMLEFGGWGLAGHETTCTVRSTDREL
jgi:hypothetical protein